VPEFDEPMEMSSRRQGPSVEERLRAEVVRLQRRVSELEKRASEDSWTRNPDRMGGSFSQDEIDRARGDTWQ